MIRSEEIKPVLRRSSANKQWVYNRKIDAWLQNKLNQQNDSYAKRQEQPRLREFQLKQKQQRALQKETLLREFPKALRKKYTQLPDHPIVDSCGTVWYYCMLCKQWYPSTQMAVYGGVEEGCRGTCSQCGRKAIWSLEQ